MISIETLAIAGLDRAVIERWIEQDWVRPSRQGGVWLFREIDIARLHLIRDLHLDLHVAEDTIPLVLRLLDQLYDTRRNLRLLCDTLDRTAPPDIRDAVIAALLTPAD